MDREHTYLKNHMSGIFNDHQATELVDLRAKVAGLKAVIEALKLDNQELTKAYYALLKKIS